MEALPSDGGGRGIHCQYKTRMQCMHSKVVLSCVCPQLVGLLERGHDDDKRYPSECARGSSFTSQNDDGLSVHCLGGVMDNDHTHGSADEHSSIAPFGLRPSGLAAGTVFTVNGTAKWFHSGGVDLDSTRHLDTPFTHCIAVFGCT